MYKHKYRYRHKDTYTDTQMDTTHRQTDTQRDIHTQRCIQTHTSSEGVPVALHITAGARSPEDNSVSFKLFAIVTRGGPVGAAHQHYNNY